MIKDDFIFSPMKQPLAVSYSGLVYAGFILEDFNK